MDKNEPNAPLFPLQAAAITMHENMMTFISAGFTRAEALQIVTTMLVEAMKSANRPGTQ